VLSELRAPEFTGERVIPGRVNENLFNEHRARYRFAARFAEGAQVLDAGCGAGYGAAELAGALSITGFDVSAEAIGLARANFSRPGVRFLQADCAALPFADASFDLVAAFEVIEHLDQWREMLTESRRVLKPQGLLLVSTPNKAYYAESRAAQGPNPFHRHEFAFEEFEAALSAVFAHVRIWTQNLSETIVFAPVHPDSSALEAGGDAAPANANFFLAACSQSEFAHNDVFAWLPESGNLLRQREHHIRKLEGELAKKDAWLAETLRKHESLQREHERTLAELKERNQWAERLNVELNQSGATIRDLQSEAGERLKWIRDLEAQIEAGRAEIARLNRHREELERDLADRAAWGQALDEQLRERNLELDQKRQVLDRLREERRLIAQSKWIRLGRKLNVGPVVEDE